MITDDNHAEYPNHHSNKYSADAECRNCLGIVRHEPWCIQVNQNVLYAYSLLLEANVMHGIDRQFLEEVKVSWTNECPGQCPTNV